MKEFELSNPLLSKEQYEKMYTESFDNKEQFIKYYTMVNSYRQMLPESDYWRTMMENISQKLNSVDEVVKIFSK